MIFFFWLTRENSSFYSFNYLQEIYCFCQRTWCSKKKWEWLVLPDTLGYILFFETLEHLPNLVHLCAKAFDDVTWLSRNENQKDFINRLFFFYNYASYWIHFPNMYYRSTKKAFRYAQIQLIATMNRKKFPALKWIRTNLT